jgi:hypothetical protein
MRFGEWGKIIGEGNKQGAGEGPIVALKCKMTGYTCLNRAVENSTS